MHIKGKNNWIKHLDFTLINIASLIIGFVIAYAIYFGDFSFITYRSWRIAIIVMCLCQLLVILMADPFSGIMRRSYSEDVLTIMQMTIYSFILVAILFYLTKTGSSYSRVTIGLAYALSMFLSCIFTAIRKKRILSGKAKNPYERTRRLLVVADSKNIDEVIKSITCEGALGYEIAAFSFTDGHSEKEYNGKPVVDISETSEYITNSHIDDVFVSVNPAALCAQSYGEILKNNVTVHFDLEPIIKTEAEAQFISRIGNCKAASFGPYTFTMRWAAYMVLKRIIDIIFAIIGCIMMIPMIIVIKACCLASGDKKSIFYSHVRIGQFGKEFKLYKFRSMVPNADEVLEELLKDEKYREEWDRDHKFEDDPRVTKLGKFLRKTSIDEFPQFINILKGDMSLIGPRPLVKGELAEHGGITLYNRVRPGVTGWWGCNGRSDIDYKERLELEYYYVKNCSMYLDILIIVKTIIAILKKDGAR